MNKIFSILIFSVFIISACTSYLPTEVKDEIIAQEVNPNANKELGEVCFGDEECISKRCLFIEDDGKSHCSEALPVDNTPPPS